MARCVLIGVGLALVFAFGAGGTALARARGDVAEIRRVHHAWLVRLAAGDESACRDPSRRNGA